MTYQELVEAAHAYYAWQVHPTHPGYFIKNDTPLVLRLSREEYNETRKAVDEHFAELERMGLLTFVNNTIPCALWPDHIHCILTISGQKVILMKENNPLAHGIGLP